MPQQRVRPHVGERLAHEVAGEDLPGGDLLRVQGLHDLEARDGRAGPDRQGKAEPASLMGKTVRNLCQRLIPRGARLAGDRGTRAPLHFGDPLRLVTPLAGDSGVEAVEQFRDQPGALIFRKLKGILKQFSRGFRHGQSLLSVRLKWKIEPSSITETLAGKNSSNGEGGGKEPATWLL